MPSKHPKGDYQVERANAIRRFEETYLAAALMRADGNVSKAARESGVDRVYFYRLMRKHGFKRGGDRACY